MVSRRDILRAAGAGTIATALPHWAFAKTESDARFVLVILRGAADGLAIAAPYGDPDYRKVRGELALPAPGENPGGNDPTGRNDFPTATSRTDLGEVVHAVERVLRISDNDNDWFKVTAAVDGSLTIVLDLEDGRIREVTSFRPSTERVGDVAFPDLNFLNLLLGHRSFDTLYGLLPDCMLHDKSKRALLEALFPPQPSFIMATS